MNTSLYMFLRRLIDYAGLFPPAHLPLDTAIRNYAAYRRHPDSWMLGRFIIPATRLTELDPFVPLFADNPPLEIAALGRRSVDAASCESAVRADLALIAQFRDTHDASVSIKAFELPLPPTPLTPNLLAVIAVEMAAYNLYAVCEITTPLDAAWQTTVITTIDALAQHNLTSDSPLGFKLRTGGVTADAFPTPQQVATALSACRDRRVALKCTAGLHHPLRQFRAEVNTVMHGFINVFGAGMLAYTHTLDVVTIEAILSDTDPSAFRFTPESFAWRDYQIATTAIERLRAERLLSYGSCSFDEPRDDLRTLHVLN